jgi:hypothetical protein
VCDNAIVFAVRAHFRTPCALLEPAGAAAGETVAPVPGGIRQVSRNKESIREVLQHG